jgi:hypothetical protein
MPGTRLTRQYSDLVSLQIIKKGEVLVALILPDSRVPAKCATDSINPMKSSGLNEKIKKRLDLAKGLVTD